MSNKYKHDDYIPSNVLCKRLDELSEAVTKGADSINREFYMSIPAQRDSDADLVLSGASMRIASLELRVMELIQLSQEVCDCELIGELSGRIKEINKRS